MSQWNVRGVCPLYPVDVANGVFDVTNRAFFANLSAYACDWTCEDDGVLREGPGDGARPGRGGRTPRPAIRESQGVIVVNSAGVEWAVFKKTGALTSWKVGGDERLAVPLEPNFWRAPTQNGKGSGVSDWQQPWK